MYIIIILIIEGKNQKILTRERDDRDERETKKKQLLAEIRRKQFFYFFEYDWWSMIDWYIEKTHTSGVCPYPKKKNWNVRIYWRSNQTKKNDSNSNIFCSRFFPHFFFHHHHLPRNFSIIIHSCLERVFHTHTHNFSVQKITLFMIKNLIFEKVFEVVFF